MYSEMLAASALEGPPPRSAVLVALTLVAIVSTALILALPAGSGGAPDRLPPVAAGAADVAPNS